MVNIGVLSDTHLPFLTDEFRRQVEIMAREVDHFFHLGDTVSPQITEFLDTLDSHGVAGNMDPAMVIYSWPPRRIVELEGRRFGLVHGWGPRQGLEDRVLGEFIDERPKVDCVCFGHSHAPFNEVRRGVLLFNPGSARPDYGPRATCGIIRITPQGITGEHRPFWSQT